MQIEKFYKNKTILYALLSVVFLVSFHDVIRQIVRDWNTSDGSHGILIFGVSLYLVWLNRKELRRLVPQPELLSGGILFAAGCFMFYAGVISSTIMIQLLSIVPVLLGAILLFGGRSYFKIFFLPVAYLVFLTGLMEQILGGFAIYLQQLSALFTAVFFRLIGMPVFLDNTVIMLPHIALEVVRACSGISHIIALFALAVPLAHLAQNTWPRKIILVFSALVIGLFANGLRIVMIGLFTMYFPEAGVHGPAETFQVSVIFFFGLMLLLAFSSILSRKDGKNNPEEPNDPDIPNTEDPRGPTYDIDANGRLSRKQTASFVIGTLVFLVTVGMVNFYTPASVALTQSLDQFPAYIAGFAGENIEGVDKKLRPFPADNELFRRYENGSGENVTIYIGYFESQNRSRKIIDYRRAWMHENPASIQVTNGENTFVINKTRIPDRNNPTDLYFWYQMDGRVIRDQYTGKLLTFLNGLFKQRTNAAVIIITTDSDTSNVMALIGKMVGVVDTHLSGM